MSEDNREYYRVKDWDHWFEDHRTREIKNLWWTPVPNWMNTSAYAEIMDRPDGASTYGVWLAVVQCAGKSRLSGALARETCEPHNPESFSRLVRMPTDVVETALELLVTVGWVEQVTLSLSNLLELAREVRGGSAGVPRKYRSTGEERRGQDINPHTPAKRGTPTRQNSNGNHKPTRQENRDRKALEHMELLEGMEGSK